uniref:VTE2-1 n=1 Tax=Arundo donax TaxID=35708 RepID=A0A0A9EAV1_ARUDO
MSYASGRPSSPRGPAPPAAEIIFYHRFVLSNEMVKDGFVFPAKGPKAITCITVRNSSIGNPPIVG